MENMLRGRHSFLNFVRIRIGVPVIGLLLLGLSDPALAQQIGVVGTVTSSTGAPLPGVTVRVLEADTVRALTDANGRYNIIAPSNGSLIFTRLGHRVVQEEINGRTTIDITMEPIAFLEEIVVTAYTAQRRADITGAVASVDLESAARQTSASILKRLDASTSGVTVESSGSPGSRSTVRIRGISSFQNNNPLYIVDGTPVQDSYVNWLNPNDITSIQVLKDASAASIYGARASNGVIVIETTQRGVEGPPRATLRLRTGVTSPVRGYDDFLMTDALDYFEIVKRSYLNAGYPLDSIPTNIYGDPDNPTIPQYTYADDDLTMDEDEWGRPIAVDELGYAYPDRLIMPASTGTNWWDAVFGTGWVSDVNLDVSGGSAATRYGVSFNYFDQDGTAAFNHFRRGSIRVNTAFTRGRLTIGENIALAHDRHNGGMPDDPGGFAEDGIIGKNILMQPVVPIYDIAGNFASGKATGLGNATNPLKFAEARRHNRTENNRLFGNVFGNLDVNERVALRSTFGFNLGRGSSAGFNPITPENAEPSLTNSIFENSNEFTDWTWSNTMTYGQQFGPHNVRVLLGQEANETVSRFIAAGMANLLNPDPDFRYIQDALGDADTKNVSSSGGRGRLLSFFGRADYNFDERYILSLTLRHDGSSRMGPSHRWATFPAVGLGWRLSNEPFMASNTFFSDVMLRFGWGMTGNQAIPEGRIVSQFGGSRGDTFYAIGGEDAVVAGFRQTSLGNPDLKWEENTSVNVGADVAMLDGSVLLTLDVYQRETDNLLFDPRNPATAGIAAPAILNVGKMRNRGFDLSLGYNAASWSVTLNGSHYKNEIVRIDGQQDFFFGPISTRFGNQVINQVGQPIGAFYGLVADGFFRDAADVAGHAVQDGAAPGRIKFRDITGNDTVTLADRAIIGSPHPDFTAGLDFQYRYGDWDLSATVFGSFGNDIFDAQKEFYVFRNFSTNVRRELLTDSWTPENLDAKYPRLDINDVYSSAISSFYVEDGTYVRLRNVQIGYNVPANLMGWLRAERIYLQMENLFTITGYDGLDPALPAANVSGAAGDIRDQYRGVDRGSYPSNRTFSIGLVTTF